MGGKEIVFFSLFLKKILYGDRNGEMDAARK